MGAMKLIMPLEMATEPQTIEESAVDAMITGFYAQARAARAANAKHAAAYNNHRARWLEDAKGKAERVP
jgi:hypothetical protein